MSWESGIRYNSAVYDATEQVLETMPVEWLATAIANDKYDRMFPYRYTMNESPESRDKRYARRKAIFDRWLRDAMQLPHDILVSNCLERAARTDTADNGGFAVWIDRSGCSRVTLPQICPRGSAECRRSAF